MEPLKPGENILPVLDEVAAKLAEPPIPGDIARSGACDMPSLTILGEIMARLRAAIFPGYFGQNRASSPALRYHLAANLDSIHRLLSGQIVAGLCFACQNQRAPCINCDEQGQHAALELMRKLPEIRRKLTLDANAAYEEDPAAVSPGETIFCYPSLTAMFHHRIAHELYRLKIPIVPRIMAEMAHSSTGIDIHPGAQVGESFFIDHGTGVVIGETAIIGDRCRLYQGVTLGAMSFPKNPDGSLTKGIPRHPILEDDVTVYAGATILGRITIGTGATIGGNTWVTRNVPPHAKISLGKDW